MRAIILAGGVGSSRFPFDGRYPKIAQPVLAESLLVRSVENLERAGITEVAVTYSRHGKWFRSEIDRLARRRDLSIRVCAFHDASPSGTAGCLRYLGDFVGDDDFVVISSNVFAPDLEIDSIRRQHTARGTSVTVATADGGTADLSLENLDLDAEEQVRGVVSLHRSLERRRDGATSSNPWTGVERRRSLKPAGIFIVHPRVLEVIPSKGYMDLKEQLLPRLYDVGDPAAWYRLTQPVRHVNDVEDCFRLNQELLPAAVLQPEGDTGSRLNDEVWVGKDATVAAGAVVSGPVVIGDGCVIETGARVIGPTSLSRGTRIKKGATVRQCLTGPDAVVGEGASIEECFIARNVSVHAFQRVERSFVTRRRDIGHRAQSPYEKVGSFRVLLQDRHRRWAATTRACECLKRLLDVSVSVTMLSLLSPLLAIIGAAVRLESEGPVTYRQKRCGKDGREFHMYKFRTMVVDAETWQQELFPHKDVDGPMFKMFDDPRVTRIGHFLRRTSIDELPQLWNVLKGDMSLVGPRPLVMHEMRFAPSWRDLRLAVRPGITGLWQINGRGDIAFHSWIQNDTQYVRTQSPMLDFEILLKTFKVLKIENYR